MATVKASLTTIMYDNKDKVVGVSYNTTIPTSLPIWFASEIIRDIIGMHLSHTERINGANKLYGKLSCIVQVRHRSVTASVLRVNLVNWLK